MRIGVADLLFNPVGNNLVLGVLLVHLLDHVIVLAQRGLVAGDSVSQFHDGDDIAVLAYPS